MFLIDGAGSEPIRKFKAPKNKKRKRCEEEDELPAVKDISGDAGDSEGAGARVCTKHQLKTKHEGSELFLFS